jgi:hydrogenase-4 component E
MPALMVALIVLLPLATLVCLRAPYRIAASVAATSGIICLVLAVALEMAFVLDLLVAVIVFGIATRSNQQRTRSHSTETLERLRG